MLWLEMVPEPAPGGGEWGFTRSLWAPARSRRGRRSAYWETLLQVEEGDVVLHLTGKGTEAALVGFSTAASDGFETTERPPRTGEWGYAERFYRVLLKEYTPFAEVILLPFVFNRQADALRAYYESNRARTDRRKRRLFYELRAGRPQLHKGAYLSELDGPLADILLEPFRFPAQISLLPHLARDVSTREQIARLRGRVARKHFSDEVRRNYDQHCCFPGCDVAESRFLTGTSIAHLSPAPESVTPAPEAGLCFCLMHDKAFELGLFTLDADLAVWSTPERLQQSPWAEAQIGPAIGKPIRSGHTPPPPEVIRRHWERSGLLPPDQTDSSTRQP